MSTAGKVLVVLNALMLVIWLVLMAGVTELNINGGQKLAQLTKDVETAKGELATTEKNVRDLREQVTQEQIGKEDDLRVLRANLSNSERAVSITLETLSRIQVQLDEYTKALARSEEVKTQRQEEKVALEADRAKEETLVKTLQEQNTGLLAELQGLRDKFKQVTEQNRQAVSNILNKGGNSTRPAARPAARPASLVR